MNYIENKIKWLLNTINILFNDIDPDDMVKQLNFVQGVENEAYKRYIKNTNKKIDIQDVPF